MSGYDDSGGKNKIDAHKFVVVGTWGDFLVLSRYIICLLGYKKTIRVKQLTAKKSNAKITHYVNIPFVGWVFDATSADDKRKCSNKSPVLQQCDWRCQKDVCVCCCFLSLHGSVVLPSWQNSSCKSSEVDTMMMVMMMAKSCQGELGASLIWRKRRGACLSSLPQHGRITWCGRWQQEQPRCAVSVSLFVLHFYLYDLSTRSFSLMVLRPAAAAVSRATVTTVRFQVKFSVVCGSNKFNVHKTAL